jgi:hypothetical protein
MKLSDITRTTDTKHVELTLGKMAIHFRRTCQWIDLNLNRTIESRVLHNLLWGSSNYLKLGSENLNSHISVLGVAVRGLYELQLRTQLVLEIPDEFNKWQAEAGTDKIQMIEGILGISTEGRGDSQRKILTDEIARLRSLLAKHGLQEARPQATADIAKKLGKEEEHKSLFKLLSKVVHPTSYLINDYTNAASEEIYYILQIHAQLYAWDSYERTCERLSVPQEVRDFQLPPESDSN